MSCKKFVYIYIIADRSLKDRLEKEVYDFGGALINCIYGRGYYESRNVLDYLGFSGKKGKAIISSLIERCKAIELISKLNEAYAFSKPDSGIAFTIPVEKIVY